MADQTPFNLLSSIRSKALELAAQGGNIHSQSTGVKNIAFLVNDTRYYCAASDIKEVTTCENLVPVPQTKRWMRGLINSKGVLYSVSDLSLLAGHDRVIDTKRGHLLIGNDAESQSALLVSRVLGFRYFDRGQKLNKSQLELGVVDDLGSFVNEAYEFEGHDWYRLDIDKLITSEQFREIQ